MLHPIVTERQAIVWMFTRLPSYPCATKEQRKFIKYNHLVANLLIFHNVVTMSKALERMVADGYSVDADLIACSSPYLTGHLNRFGRYELTRTGCPNRWTASANSECPHVEKETPDPL